MRKIGDDRAIVPLLTLSEGFWRSGFWTPELAREATALLLSLGWKLDHSYAGIQYLIWERQLEKIVAMGARAVPNLVLAIRKGDPEVSSAAFLALEQIGDRRAVDALIAALGDKFSLVRQNAAEALGKIADLRAVDVLVATLGDEDSAVRCAAGEALGEIGDPRAVAALAAALGDDYRSDVAKYGSGLTQCAVSALARIGPPSVTALAAALGDEDSLVRQRAGEALQKISDPRAVDALTTALIDKHRRVRQAAAEVLGRIGDRRAVGALVTALDDKVSLVRLAAVEALGKTGDARAVEALTAALGEKDSQVRQAAARALGEIGDPRAVAALAAALEDENSGVRHAAAGALDHVGWRPDVSQAGTAYRMAKAEITLGGEKAALRQAAARKLGEIGGPRAVEVLAAALLDEIRSVRHAAAWALERLGWRPDVSKAAAAYWIINADAGKCVAIGSLAVKPLVTALGDEDKDVRRAAAGALIEIYASGKIDDKQKKFILAHRGQITNPHCDEQHDHYDKNCDVPGAIHMDYYRRHSDSGIGIRFDL